MSRHYDKCLEVIETCKSNTQAHFNFIETFKPINGSTKTTNHKMQTLARLKGLPRWVHLEVSGYHDGMCDYFKRHNIVHGTWHPELGFLCTHKSHPDYYLNKLPDREGAEFAYYEFVKAYGTGLFYSDRPERIWFADKPEWVELHMSLKLFSCQPTLERG